MLYLLLGVVLGLALAWNVWTEQPVWFKNGYDWTLAYLVKGYYAVKDYFDRLFKRNGG